MSLPSAFFAPSFRQQRLGWLFAILVGITVYLASFATFAEAGLSAATWTWNLHTASRLTVEIPPISDETTTPQNERVRQVQSILKAMPSIAHVTRIGDEETQRLLQPWVSQPEFLKSLPLPVLIDIDRVEGNPLSAEDVRQQVKSAVPDVRVDDHAAWLTDLRDFIHGVTSFGALLILLTAFTLVTVVHLLCRAIMAAEHETISLLHIMGAEDDDIARHFARHAGMLAWLPALGGFILAMLSSGALTFVTRHFVDLTTVPILVWISIGVGITCVPISAVVIAYITARLSTLNTLLAVP